MVSVLTALSRRCRSRRNQSDRILAPALDHDEDSPEGVHSERQVPGLIAAQDVLDCHGAVVLERGRRIGEIDPVLLQVRGGFAAVPLDGHGLRIVCTFVHPRNWGITPARVRDRTKRVATPCGVNSCRYAPAREARPGGLAERGGFELYPGVDFKGLTVFAR